MKREKETINPFQIYLNQINKISLLLTRREEEICARKAKQGDRNAIEQLIHGNLRFVVFIALKYKNLGLPIMDVISEGNLGLIKALQKYDCDRGIRFISYAKWWVRYYILRAITKSGSSFKVPRGYLCTFIKKSIEDGDPDENRGPKTNHVWSLDQSHEDNNRTNNTLMSETDKHYLPDELFLKTCGRETLLKALQKLRPIERDIIIRHYGLYNVGPLTLREIGQHYSLSKERIRKIEHAALKKLRHPHVKAMLFDFTW